MSPEPAKKKLKGAETGRTNQTKGSMRPKSSGTSKGTVSLKNQATTKKSGKV